MTNCLNHSGATEAKLTFVLEDGRLNIHFVDNGTGYTDNELLRKNGLLNMQRRAEKINSKLKIISSNGVKVSFFGVLQKKIILKPPIWGEPRVVVML